VQIFTVVYFIKVTKIIIWFVVIVYYSTKVAKKFGQLATSPGLVACLFSWLFWAAGG
jgi:hypothetical protein